MSKKQRVFKLGSKKISNWGEPYVIAEIGVNHEGSLSLAKELIYQAKEGGADAAKFQSYKASKIASKNAMSYWDTSLERTKNQYELFKKYDKFNPSDYEKLKEYSDELKIDFLSTPFDHEAVNFLDELVPFFKVASADITNIPMLELIAKKKKPIILSTGASDIKEINLAIDTLKQSECEEIVLLHCILNYPTENHNANLKMIKHLSDMYKEFFIGYSDHTLPDKHMNTLVYAYLLGAIVIEKHFTNDKTKQGNDHYHAMDKYDLKNFINRISEIKELIGESITKEPIEGEEISRKNARRSLVLSHSLKKNHLLIEEDILCKRPGTGISPINIKDVIGKKLTRNLEEDHILEWNDIN